VPVTLHTKLKTSNRFPVTGAIYGSELDLPGQPRPGAAASHTTRDAHARHRGQPGHHANPGWPGRPHRAASPSDVIGASADPDAAVLARRIGGGYVLQAHLRPQHCQANRLGRADVGSASGPASPALVWPGRRVGGLGPGLTSESADAVSVCPAKRSAGRVPGFFLAPTSAAGLICLAWEEAGVRRSDGQRVRAIPSTTEKRWH
jgi:hypothetical protein